MKTVRFEDPSAFLDLAGAFLRRNEGGNQLVLGIAADATAGRRGFTPFRGWVVVDGAPTAAAVRTPPRNPVLADPVSERALAALAVAVHEDAPDAPGVIGNIPAVDRFAETWTSRTGERARVAVAQGVWEVDRLEDVDRPPGAAEPAALDEAGLLAEWFVEFEAEATVTEPSDREEMRRSIVERLTDARSGVWVWRDTEIVSMAGYAGPTGTGIRIGPVYTPPERRRRGYATALVADLSAHLLATGYQRCFLYTDLANPTPNRIYAAIGYRRIAESRMLAFER